MAREVPKQSMTVAIKVDGHELGVLDPETLTMEAQFDLEGCQTTLQMLRWISKYAGGDFDRNRAVLGPLPISTTRDLINGVNEALSHAIDVPK